MHEALLSMACAGLGTGHWIEAARQSGALSRSCGHRRLFKGVWYYCFWRSGLGTISCGTNGAVRALGGQSEGMACASFACHAHRLSRPRRCVVRSVGGAAGAASDLATIGTVQAAETGQKGGAGAAVAVPAQPLYGVCQYLKWLRRRCRSSSPSVVHAFAGRTLGRSFTAQQGAQAWRGSGGLAW